MIKCAIYFRFVLLYDLLFYVLELILLMETVLFDVERKLTIPLIVIHS